MEPEVTNQPKINKNTFKIGSGDLQQQVANNTKRIAAVSVLLKSSRRNSSKYLTPTVSNLQETLAESNLILADIAIQLQQDFDSQELREQRLLQKNREDKLELKRTNNEADSNQFPRMLGDWVITKTTYKLPDFPYWNFTNKIIPYLKRHGGNTGIGWNRNFIREMTKVPGVLYVGHLRPPTPNRITRRGWDELWFSQHSPFHRLIKRFNLPTLRYKGITYTRLWQSRYKAKQGQYGFEYGFPYWTFFQAAAAN